MRQSSSPGPPSTSPAYHDSAPSLPQLARPDITNLSRTQASSKPDLTSHSKPMDRPTLVRPTPRAHNPPEVSYMGTPKPPSPEVTYMGTKKDPPDYGYQQNNVKEIDYSSTFSNIPIDKGTINFEDFLPVSINTV